MFDDINLAKLAESNRLYYIKYGRGAVIGGGGEPLDTPLSVVRDLISENHRQEIILIKSFNVIDDYAIFEIEQRENSILGDSSNRAKFTVTKKIPLSQISFEYYQSMNDKY